MLLTLCERKRRGLEGGLNRDRRGIEGGLREHHPHILLLLPTVCGIRIDRFPVIVPNTARNAYSQLYTKAIQALYTLLRHTLFTTLLHSTAGRCGHRRRGPPPHRLGLY